MATVAVVGGLGFLGGHLVSALLSSGHDVTVVDVARSSDVNCTYRQADVGDRSSLRGALRGAEVVYNLAAVHRDDIRPIARYEEVNVLGAENVCAVCREIGVSRIVFTSSVAVYGAGGVDTSEEANPKPSNPYGRTKLLAENVHREWQDEATGIRTLVVVRPTVIFGEGNRGNVFELIRQISSQRFFMVGGGENRKSMAYVGNVSSFLVYALRLSPGVHLFNYVDGPDLSMRELVEVICLTLGRSSVPNVRIPYVVGYLGGVACDIVASLAGRSLPISAARVRKFCSTTTFSSRRVDETGFRAPFDLRGALVRTVEYEAVRLGLSGAQEDG